MPIIPPHIDGNRCHTPLTTAEMTDISRATMIHVWEWDIREVILAAEGKSNPSLPICRNPDLSEHLPQEPVVSMDHIIESAKTDRPDLISRISALATLADTKGENLLAPSAPLPFSASTPPNPSNTDDPKNPKSDDPIFNPKFSDGTDPKTNPHYFEDIDPLAEIDPRTGKHFRQGATRPNPEDGSWEMYRNDYGFASKYEWDCRRFVKDINHAPMASKYADPRRPGRVENLTNRRGQIVEGITQYTGGKGISEMWFWLFEENETIPLEERMTDDELIEYMITAFPQRQSGKRIRNITAMRAHYNAGRLPCQKGHVPTLRRSFRYIRGSNNLVFKITPRGRVLDTNLQDKQTEHLLSLEEHIHERDRERTRHLSKHIMHTAPERAKAFSASIRQFRLDNPGLLPTFVCNLFGKPKTEGTESTPTETQPTKPPTPEEQVAEETAEQPPEQEQPTKPKSKPKRSAAKQKA